MLTLYHGATSVCAAKVRLALDHKSLGYEGRLLDLSANEHRTSAYLALNPNGVVPTLVHDGSVVIESTLINEYIEDIAPKPTLLPARPLERMRMRAWTKRLDEGLHNAVSVLTFAVVLRHERPTPGTPEYTRYLDGIGSPERRAMLDAAITLGPRAPQAKAAVDLYKTALARVESDLEDGPWLAGPHYSLADCGLTPYVHRLAQLRLSPLWDSLPRLNGWYERVRALPSFETAVAGFITPTIAAKYETLGAASRGTLLA